LIESGTGLLFQVSRVSNWPVSGSRRFVGEHLHDPCPTTTAADNPTIEGSWQGHGNAGTRAVAANRRAPTLAR
jgi:hypothetical protein